MSVYDWITAQTAALAAAFRRSVSREEKARCLDAMEEVTRLCGELAA